MATNDYHPSRPRRLELERRSFKPFQHGWDVGDNSLHEWTGLMLLKVLSFKFKGWAHNAGTDIPVPVPIKTVILPDRFLPLPTSRSNQSNNSRICFSRCCVFNADPH